jgi:TRAP-type uncharacterized transport system substrate-binding protein
MKRVSTIALAAAAVLAIAAPVSAQVKLTAATSGKNSIPWYVTGHTGEVAAAKGIANIQMAEGQTLTKTVQAVAEGKTDISGAPLVLPFLLSKGLGPYAALGKDKGAALASNLRALYPYNVGGFFMMAFQSKGYKGWEDLKGKTVWNGPPSGAALVNARQAIAINTGMSDGKEYKGAQDNWDALNTKLVDGSADAFVIPMALPHARVTVMSSAGKVVMFCTPKAKAESPMGKKIMSGPGNVPLALEINKLGYTNNPDVKIVGDADGKCRGLGSAFADVVHKDMSFDLAKKLTEAHISTLKALIAKNPSIANIGLAEMDPDRSSFCGPNPLKYHPGAAAAWKEAGYKLPACALVQ